VNRRLFNFETKNLVYVDPAAAYHLTAALDRAADHHTVPADPLLHYRAAYGTGAGGTHVATLDALAIGRAALFHTNAARADSNVDPLG
jgi:hypothetical protein